MIPLYLLRHGPAMGPEGGAPTGRMDVPLSEGALALWPRVKAELLELGIQRVLCSDLRRSKEPALDLGLPCLVLPDLGEQAFGEWEGQPWAEMRGGEAFLGSPVHTAPPGGESFAHCASRSLLILQGALDGEAPTLVLGHGGPLRAILAHFLGLPLDRALDLAWPPYGLTKLEVHGSNRAVLRYHNRTMPRP
ncbi:MAG: histidine phosphatase family protein [Acidobacteria bacterium]|nr:histidine phosphatase family protein [Acidobacteriota bacterium]